VEAGPGLVVDGSTKTPYGGGFRRPAASTNGRWSLVSSSSAVVDGEPATGEQYLALPENPRVEFIDGRLRVRPSASRRHQKAALELAAALSTSLPPGCDVTLAWAWKAGDDEFIPDVTVHPVTEEDDRFTGVPLLVAEVVSTRPSASWTSSHLRGVATGWSGGCWPTPSMRSR
jgi:hypothetical protein